MHTGNGVEAGKRGRDASELLASGERVRGGGTNSSTPRRVTRGGDSRTTPRGPPIARLHRPRTSSVYSTDTPIVHTRSRCNTTAMPTDMTRHSPHARARCASAFYAHCLLPTANQAQTPTRARDRQRPDPGVVPTGYSHWKSWAVLRAVGDVGRCDNQGPDSF